MRLLAPFLALVALVLPAVQPLAAREAVEASAPTALSVTVYRDPNRSTSDRMNRSAPQGFAMISETRTVTLPRGESTVRFTGVAEGMVAVSAIVTGLPGGTIEKNRNADLLSPAALVDGTLGNRVRITRTNPATGQATSEEAIVHTRADGGIVLQTAQGFEAVRCAGIPETLSFDKVPAGLSASPVYSIDTVSPEGGTYQITLTYIAWGFDWEANYVATLRESGVRGKVALDLMSWLTVLNDNGQSFPDATLLAVAGKINVTSNFEDLADPPQGRPLSLTCYPIGSTAAGSPVPDYRYYPIPPPPAPPMMYAPAQSIVVSGSALRREMVMDKAVAVQAAEEQLGDLKLYRVPETMTVNAKGLKQVAFLNRQDVKGEFFYIAGCTPYDLFRSAADDPSALGPAQLTLFMKNDKKSGLGVALPMGKVALFEPGSAGTQLVSELNLRDYAVDQDIELSLGASHMVHSQCAAQVANDPDSEGQRGKWLPMRAEISNANEAPVRVRFELGQASVWDLRWPGQRVRIKDGQQIIEVTVPANATRTFDWKIRHPDSYFSGS